MTRTAAALLAVVAAAALAGCGGGAKAKRRDDVDRYVRRVNAIQADAAAEWGKAETAVGSLGTGKLTDKELRGLAAAPPTIRALRSRVATVTPPADARRLHRLLLRLLDLDAGFADDVARFGRYVHDVTPIEARLGAETVRLRDAVRQSHARATEDEALTRYVQALAPLERRLAALRPPTALSPWHREQVVRTRRLVAGARELRLGLRRNDRAEATRGLSTLQAATTQQSVTAADRRAIVAYNARLAQIRRLAAAVATEQTRLARTLT